MGLTNSKGYEIYNNNLIGKRSANGDDYSITHAAIIEIHNLGIESFGDTATVTVHIGKIRDKIQEDPSKHQFIETVWGAGYWFKV
jgi:hypothetical protein